MDNTTPAVSLRGIRKTFGSVVANDHVDLDIRFDIVTVVGTPDMEPEVEHIENAF